MGNGCLTWFGTRTSKSRVNFLELLRRARVGRLGRAMNFPNSDLNVDVHSTFNVGAGSKAAASNLVITETSETIPLSCLITLQHGITDHWIAWPFIRALTCRSAWMIRSQTLLDAREHLLCEHLDRICRETFRHAGPFVLITR
jgi:hypothetical protein